MTKQNELLSKIGIAVKDFDRYDLISLSKPKENELPRFLKESTIFFGRKGAGKTAFLKAVNEYHKQDFERYLKAKKVREERGLPPFPQEHCCFSNTPDISNYWGGGNKQSYVFDPHKFMLPNSTYEYDLIVEYGVYNFTEGATIYPSHMSISEMPEPVKNAHRNLRAMNVIANIDIQRPKDLFISIRDINTSFCRPVELLQIVDKNTGTAVYTIFKYIEFNSWKQAEEFVEEYGEDEERMLTHPNLATYIFNFDIKTIYNSFENKEIFYKKPNEQEKITCEYGQILTFDDIKGKIFFSGEFVKFNKEKGVKSAWKIQKNQDF